MPQHCISLDLRWYVMPFKREIVTPHWLDQDHLSFRFEGQHSNQHVSPGFMAQWHRHASSPLPQWSKFLSIDDECKKNLIDLTSATYLPTLLYVVAAPSWWRRLRFPSLLKKRKSWKYLSQLKMLLSLSMEEENEIEFRENCMYIWCNIPSARTYASWKMPHACKQESDMYHCV